MKKMKPKHKFFLLIIAIIAFISVFFIVFMVKNNSPKNKISSSELREAKKQLNLHILRYEEDVFSLDVNNLAEEVEQLSIRYPQFFEPNVWNDSLQLEKLKSYLQDTVILALYHAAEKKIKTDIFYKELETAFGYYKVFYPNEIIPTLVTIIPGLDITMPFVYIYDNILYIKIDMYLGADFPYYQSLELPYYIIERCEPVYLPIDIFKKAIVYKHLLKTPHTTLLEAMITEGKKLYFTEMMFPEVQEKFIIGYSDEKYNWANLYLGNVWSYLIEKNELFGKGESLMRCYIDEAPFTKPFGNESPGRIGTFIGWKLIQSYMENNPEVSLPSLIQDIDYQKILNLSKFKPQPK
jgi:hypothetical protein